MVEEAKFAEFGKRLTIACDNNDLVPEYNRGRLTWIMRELERYDVQVTKESVRRWFAGMSAPRQDKMRALAELLKVTEAWLAVGDESSGTVSEVKKRKIFSEGAVNYIIGLMAMEGFPIAHADEDDPKFNDMDFYTIVNAKQVPIRASVADVQKNKVVMTTSNNYEKVTSISVLKISDMDYRIVMIPATVSSREGTRKGSYVEVKGLIEAEGIRFKDELVPFLKEFSSLSAD
jgi:hypothetical protein